MSSIPRTRAYWLDGVEDPHSLLGRSKLNELILGFPRISVRHIVVWNFHLRRAHKDYEWTSLAGERFMVADLRGAFDGRWGLARQHIRKAHDELVEWKFLVLIHKGKGKGDGSRYWPNFDLLAQAAAGLFPHALSVSPPPSIIDRYGEPESISSTGNYGVPGSELGTTGCPVLGTTGFPVDAQTGNYGVSKDPSIQTRTQGPGMEIDGQDCAAPSAGLTPAPAGTAQGGFEELWLAYAVRQKKADARVAYDKLAPDAGLHQRMVDAAGVWRAAAGPDQARMHLRRWLETESFDCDPPVAFQPKAGPKVEPKAPSASWRGDVSRDTPRGWFPAEIFDATCTGGQHGEMTLTLHIEQFPPADGRPFSKTCVQSLKLESQDYDEQQHGQKQFAQLLDAIGLVQAPEDADDLHYRRFTWIIDDEGMATFEPPEAKQRLAA